jgi:hypothetical protein
VKNHRAFKPVLADDKEAMVKFTMRDLEEILFAAHTGMTVDSFQTIATDWTAKAKDQRWKRPYTDLVYQPMIEVLRYSAKKSLRPTS